MELVREAGSELVEYPYMAYPNGSAKYGYMETSSDELMRTSSLDPVRAAGTRSAGEISLCSGLKSPNEYVRAALE